MREKPGIVGIDLGTTHTVVAKASDRAGAQARVVPIAQLVTGSEVGHAPLLPSVLFAPPPGEATADPWNDAPFVVGSHAKSRGERVPRRAVLSPKSWLSHGAVDRLAPILPWGSGSDDETLPRVSPVEASARILGHVRRALDADEPDAPLVEQEIVLTVPASFDEVARELTVRAATDAGLTVRLLEEPLAAFYDYLGRAGTEELRELAARAGGSALVLVCDIGGGTTDLTLVRVAEEPSGVRLDRVAVGRHLLLGGDNMDLALAHTVEARLVPPPDRLEPALFMELILACRSAKERLLADDAPDLVPIRLLSRGSRLVGTTLSASLEREEVARIVLDGFFPDAALDDVPVRGRTGLVAFGLPYEQDAAITRHVAAFVAKHAPNGVRAVLLNGGVFRSPAVRARLLTLMGTWAGSSVRDLPSPDPDLAVARGAVLFGLALAGHGPRVGGGSARGYYVGLAARGLERRAVCVVPRGSPEGERHVVRIPGLSLVVGEPARFDLFATDEGIDRPGDIVAVDERFTGLPSMTATFDDPSAGGSRLPVRLEGELTAVGTLDVACVEEGPQRSPPARRFRLAFDLRQTAAKPSSPPSMRPTDPRLARARERILAVFGEGRADADPRDARHLLRDLEQILGARAGWTTDVTRTLFDVVAPRSKARRRSAEHERAFWMLAGYCLRPGYGHPTDERRVAKVAPLFVELVSTGDEARTWQQFWIAWRRIAGGLGEPLQTAIRDAVDPFLSTDATPPKKRKGVKPEAPDEMLELASSLERVAPSRRADLGRWILERTWTDRDPRLWTALGRVGARMPTYASAHHVVPPNTVERWLDHLLREKWNDVPTAALAAARMARRTGDRIRDVSEGVRVEVARRLVAGGAALELARAVTDIVAAEARDQADFFGESLPVGLELHSPD